MTWLDYSLLVILFLTTLLGVWNGLWWQIYRVISLVLAYVLAVRFHDIGDKICAEVLDEKTAKVAGCILIFVVVLGVTYLFGRFVKKALGTKPGMLGRLFGGLLGLLKGALICCVIAFCLVKYYPSWWKENQQTPLQSATGQATSLTSTFARAGEIIAYIVPDRLRTGFEIFVKDTSTKTKEAVDDMSKLGNEMVNEFKQHKKEEAIGDEQ